MRPGFHSRGNWTRRTAIGLALLLVCSASAQTLSNKSLTGKYAVREVLLATDTSQYSTFFGTLTFDGNGGVTYSGQQLTGTNAPANVSNSGTYSVDAGGVVTLSDPLRSGSTVNARLGSGVLVGSNTESGNNVFSMLVAVAAPASATSTSTLTGTYWVASLEFLNGDPGSTRETFFQMSANGSGSLGNPMVLGEAANLGNTQITQVVTGSTYTVNADGSGSAIFPLGGRRQYPATAWRNEGHQCRSGRQLLHWRRHGGGRARIAGRDSRR